LEEVQERIRDCFVTGQWSSGLGFGRSSGEN